MRRLFKPLICLMALSLLGGCVRDSSPLVNYDAGAAEEIRSELGAGIEATSTGGGGGLGTPEGFATLHGRFQLDGDPLPIVRLNINKDVSVCAPAGPRGNEALVIGPDKGIANVLIFVSSKLPADDPVWEHPSYAELKSAEVEFDQKDCIFLSHVLAMRATQQLRILNSDPVGHNTNISPTRGPAQVNPTVPANSSVMYVPGASSSNPFPVSCNIHPWMKAHLMVLDHPYFAVTAADGTFEIANIPANVELEYRVWQETSGYLENVTADTAPWKKGRFKLTLQADERHEMNVTINRAEFE